MSWPQVALDSICEINVGRTPSRYESAYWEDGIHPWVSISDMSRSRRISQTKECISEKARVECNMKPVEAGTVLLSFKLSIGKVSLADGEVYTNEAIAALPVLDKNRLDAGYLARALEAIDFTGTGNRAVMGATLNKASLRKLKIPLPPIEEQKRIAAILDKADELRRKRQRAIERLNQLGQAIFHDMFGGPANHVSASLKSLGKVSTGSTPPTSDASSFGGTVPFITPGALGSDEDVKRTLTESGAAKSRLVAAGATFVCCIGATIGKMDQATEQSAFNQQINAVEWSDRIHPTFGFFAVQQIRDVIIHKGKGASTTLPILKKSEFEKLEVIVPPLNDQRIFAARIGQIRTGQVSMSSHCAQLEALFVSLQHRAFQGEL